jgi:uncharacterized protein YpuA (DUF1002 family)
VQGFLCLSFPLTKGDEKMTEDLETQQAKLIRQVEQKIGRTLTDREIRKVLSIPAKKGDWIRVRGRLVKVNNPNDIDPITGKKLKDSED